MKYNLLKAVYAPILGAALAMTACYGAPEEPDPMGMVCGYDRGVVMRGQPGDKHFSFAFESDSEKLGCERIITPTTNQRRAIDQIVQEME